MKAQALSVMAAVSLLGLTACSQQSAAPKNTANSSKTYYVQTHKQAPKAQQIVFQQQQQRAPSYKQGASQQQVKQPAVQKPRVVSKPTPRPPTQDARQQAELSELYGIGDQIFKNETGGRIDQLVHWNLREDFAAMGIGHFTWYPSGRSQRFGNTFPG